MMSRLASLLLIVSLTVLVLPGCQPAAWTPTPDEARTWVAMLGTDTLSVEQFTVDGDTIRGTVIERAPYTHVFTYVATLGSDGHVSSLEVTKTTPASNPAGPAREAWNVVVTDSLATVTILEGTGVGERTVAVPPGTIPTLGRSAPSMYAYSQALAQKQAGEDIIHLLGPTGGARPRAVTWEAPASFGFDYFGSPITGVFDEGGQLIGASGATTTVKKEVARVEPYDILPSAERWAALDAAGEGIGTPSPGATAMGEVDGATLEIRYSQPAMRGRTIWGGLVPDGAVWRTGANAATHLTTTADLAFGEHVLPAGTYTLWSEFSGTTGELIVNAQTNQWGTSHDPAQDLFRVPLTPTTTTSSLERFTISIEDTDDGGALVLAWDTTEWRAPFVVN